MMMLWKVIAGLAAICGGIASAIIIIAATVWLIAGMVGWLFEHDFASVVCGEDREEEFEYPPCPRPIPRPDAPRNPAKDVYTPPLLSADQWQVYPDVISRTIGMDIIPENVWVVDNGHSRVAYKRVEDAMANIPLGKSFRVLNEKGKVIQQGTKNQVFNYWYPF